MTASTAVTREGQEPAVPTHLNCPPKGHLFRWRPELVKPGRVSSETLGRLQSAATSQKWRCKQTCWPVKSDLRRQTVIPTQSTILRCEDGPFRSRNSKVSCALNIETARVLPEGVDLRSQRPLGICCSAVLAEGDDQPNLWYSVNPDGTPCVQMNARDISQLLDFLCRQVEAGFTIVSWNGLGFDFDILAEESGRHGLCRELAVTHVDLMFHVFCERGFAVGLDAAAKALCSRGKTKGMQAVLVP